MSIVSPKQISNIRQIEKLVKQRFNRTDIPDGAEVIRKRIVYYMDQIATAEPQPGFAKLYHDSIHELFADMDKDELIRKLIWLQLKETIAAYEDSEDLNAGFEQKGGRDTVRNGSVNRSVRLFINLGEKDGLTPAKLLQFIAESTDIETNIVERVTVKELSSFFNVPADAAAYIMEHMADKKFKGRKIRMEEADQSMGGRPGGGNSGGGGRYKGGDSYSDQPSGGRGRPGSGSRYTGDVRAYSDRDNAFKGKRRG
jgi:ATP-dependent RNA helicase DeaD